MRIINRHKENNIHPRSTLFFRLDNEISKVRTLHVEHGALHQTNPLHPVSFFYHLPFLPIVSRDPPPTPTLLIPNQAVSYEIFTSPSAEGPRAASPTWQPRLSLPLAGRQCPSRATHAPGRGRSAVVVAADCPRTLFTSRRPDTPCPTLLHSATPP
ncbi:hypothetical protein O3P69_006104 [Scylla paramamosain]|uniref:Uncharacterized protein n=1 Tax=Scylla paramamosain TaxID=85552 RepID=A0AAW0U8I6_SCYPA